MAADPDELVVLKRVRSEPEAALIINVLEDAGVRAKATGGFISGFKAEVPGDVEIVVRRGDLKAAHAALDDSASPPRG